MPAFLWFYPIFTTKKTDRDDTTEIFLETGVKNHNFLTLILTPLPK